jgi:hypothetical protein
MTKRCVVCQKELALDNFNKSKANKDGLQSYCRICDSVRQGKERETVYELRKKIIDEAGGCQSKDCYSSPHQTRLLVTGFNYGLFDLDHIDESLKQHRRETTPSWVYLNMDEFLNRVKLNLQVLCVQCHRLKSNHSRRLGNKVHQKIHGRKLPSQFIDPGYNLFNDVERVDTSVDDDGEILVTPIYSKGFYEDGWFVQRDLDGFLVSYLELQDGEGKYFMYDKDGERIL